MKDLMLDIETLGTSPGAVITQIGACYFDRETGEVADVFIENIDIADSLKHGFTIDGDTLTWWFTQDKRTFLKNTKLLKDVLHDFNMHAVFAKQVWCHATFDLPIITHAMKKMGIKPSFHYTAARDIRTLFDLSGGKKVDTKNKKTHDALEDCFHQVEYCVEYLRMINSK